MTKTHPIPISSIGPLKISGKEVSDEIMIPIATYETTMWPSMSRGAKVSREIGGYSTIIIDDRITRSIIVEADNATDADIIIKNLKKNKDKLQQLTSETSHFAKLIDYHTQLVANLIYIRFEFFSGDASGHNMATKAADHIIKWLLETYKSLKYVSISGNYCTDKKVSAVNGILGRGKYVISEGLISRKICQEILKTTPEKIVDLNIKKNLIGSIISGGLRTANAHFANMLLGFYLATGQDAANIVEGSQGITHAEIKNNSLYFSVTIPNIIVGTVGNGKNSAEVQENLKMLGCLEKRPAGNNARRLAIIAGAAILCGELSLIAAQTNPGELIASHIKFER